MLIMEKKFNVKCQKKFIYNQIVDKFVFCLQYAYQENNSNISRFLCPNQIPYNEGLLFTLTMNIFINS
jgi:hypothetical protein